MYTVWTVWFIALSLGWYCWTLTLAPKDDCRFLWTAELFFSGGGGGGGRVHLCTYSRYHNNEKTGDRGQEQRWGTRLLPSNPIHCKTANQIRGELHCTWKQPTTATLCQGLSLALTVTFYLEDLNNHLKSCLPDMLFTVPLMEVNGDHSLNIPLAIKWSRLKIHFPLSVKIQDNSFKTITLWLELT